MFLLVKCFWQQGARLADLGFCIFFGGGRGGQLHGMTNQFFSVLHCIIK